MVLRVWKNKSGHSILSFKMINDIYNKKILAFAADIPRLGRLPEPDGTAVAHSKLCGSKVTVDIKLENGAVADFAHDVKACALGQASSSIMAHHIVGSTADELRGLCEQMHKMLKEDGPAPSGKWADLEALTPVRDFKARHASTLLTFDAVCTALDMAEGKSQADAARSA
jgi:NifU-like protein involved in Fe-S cluster formation